jgi:FdhE protein
MAKKVKLGRHDWDQLPKPALQGHQICGLAEAWYEGSSLDVYWDNPDILGLILQTAFKPFVSAISENYIKLVDQEQWRRSYCPCCGGNPDFAYLDKERGARFLMCARCDSSWLFQRMECPCCGNQDQNTLAYFSDDSGLYRLYICEKCKNYLKAIDLRKTENQILLPLERLSTLDLDAQASKSGYLTQSTRVYKT